MSGASRSMRGISYVFFNRTFMLNWNSPPPGGGNTRQRGASRYRPGTMGTTATICKNELFGPQNEPEPGRLRTRRGAEWTQAHANSYKWSHRHGTQNFSA